MADKKKIEGSKVDALYQWISYDIKKMREELMTEMRLSSAQIAALYKGLKDDKASVALEQEIRYSYKQNQNIYEGLAVLLKTEVAEKLNAMEQKISSVGRPQELLNELNELRYSYMQLSSMFSTDVISKLDNIVDKHEIKAIVDEGVASAARQGKEALAAQFGIFCTDDEDPSVAVENEVRYGYKQNQNIYENLTNLVKTDIADRLQAIDDKLTALDRLQELLNELNELKYSYTQLVTNYEGLSATVSGEVVPKLDNIVNKDGIKEIVEESVSTNAQKVLDAVTAIPVKDEVKTLVEETANVNTQKVVDAIAAIPLAESVDYGRISEDIGDKLLEVLNDLKADQTVPVEEPEAPVVEIDYEKIAGDTSAKVMESLPFPEGVDYNRIDDSVASIVAEAVNVDAIAEAVAATVNVEAIAAAVAASLNIDAIAEAVAAKIVVPEVDYDELADIVVDKIVARGISADVILDDEGIDKIADTVADKVGIVENVNYDKVAEIVEDKLGTVENIDYDKVCMAAQAAQILPDPVDYDRVAEIVEDKLAKSCNEIEKVVTLDDEGIEKIVDGVANELRNMTLVCEYAEEEAAAPAEEEPVAEVAPVEEEVAVAEEPVVEELAVAVEPSYEEDLDGQLIDAETGLVVRLKRSFTAKMKQSEEQVKVYYSDIKNALTSYKRINSNVSWHGDRFNYGRETVAKMGINGKTLCFYLALDPNDPELKTTVYHQKDVGNQKAYESTPFMVKVKSDAASKKALRLVGILAEKLGAEHDESFEEVDYVAEYAYESTKQLFEEGDIKATKEKKVDFNF